MIAPYTLILHGVMAALCLGSLVYLFYKKSDTNNKTFNGYFLFFLFFFLYNILLVAVAIFFRVSGDWVSWMYVAALISLAIAARSAYGVALTLLDIGESLKSTLSFFYIFGAIAVALGHLLFIKAPTLSADGNWIFWYGNNAVSYSYIFIMFVGGWTFAFAIIRGIASLRSGFQKMRAIFLSLGAFILPFAAFYYFVATKLSDIYLAFLFSILSLTFLLIGNLIGLFRREA